MYSPELEIALTASTSNTSDVLTLDTTCAFETSTHTLTRNDSKTYESEPSGSVHTDEVVNHYESTADLDEVSVVPCRILRPDFDVRPNTSTSAWGNWTSTSTKRVC
jgi:hypothetical protein